MNESSSLWTCAVQISVKDPVVVSKCLSKYGIFQWQSAFCLLELHVQRMQ